MKRVTIYDIAKEAKVSVATVSRVLNNTAPVKTTTRNKIMDLIVKHRFQPNALARSLIKKETGMIGIILPDITNPFYPEVLSGLEQEARNKGYTFFLCDTSGDFARESQYLNILREKQVDGIIFIGGRINLLECSKTMKEELVEFSKQVPTVLINGNLPQTSLHRVATDESRGTELAVQHLIDLGHKDIAFIGGRDFMSTTIQKVQAFQETMKNNGLKVREEWILLDDFSLESGKQLMVELLNGKKRPTAVSCVNDLTAIGAVKAALQAGLQIPRDISIVGFDDMPLASIIDPELTTVSQKSRQLGQTAVFVLHQLINNEMAEKVTVIQPELVVRRSTARI